MSLGLPHIAVPCEGVCKDTRPDYRVLRFQRDRQSGGKYSVSSGANYLAATYSLKGYVFFHYAAGLNPVLGIGPPSVLGTRTYPTKRSESVNNYDIAAIDTLERFGVLAVVRVERRVDKLQDFNPFVALTFVLPIKAPQLKRAFLSPRPKQQFANLRGAYAARP